MAENLDAASGCEELLCGELRHFLGPASILSSNIFKISNFFNYQQSRSCPLGVPIDNPYITVHIVNLSYLWKRMET